MKTQMPASCQYLRAYAVSREVETGKMIRSSRASQSGTCTTVVETRGTGFNKLAGQTGLLKVVS